MPFRRGARLDTSQVRDLRGRTFRGGLGGGGIPIMVGGGGLGLIITIAVVLLMVFTNVLQPSGFAGQDNPPAQGTVGPGGLAERCQTGADANERQECAIVGYVNSIQNYWADEFLRRNQRYDLTQTTFFTDYVSTACGDASSDVGPFYCPLDQMVYIDLGFFNELQARFGAGGGPFAQAYVIAHEYGHHVQNQIGTLQLNERDTGPQSTAVRTELQADCFAGVWAHNAASTGFLEPLTDQEIAQALDAAAAVGDDRIQRAARGRVSPESWTHGSSEQRQRWFTTGYQIGNFDACNTFQGQV